MDITQLQYFRVLAKTQHMTKAAGLLNLAQPALSRSLKSLEAELGVRLFDRIGKHIYLNGDGQLFLKHVEVMLGEYEDARLALADRQGHAQKRVVLSMYAGSKLLPELIRGFKAAHPDIALQIMQQGSQSEDLAPGGITVFSARRPMEGPGTVTLMEEGICLAMPAGHPLAGRKSIDLAQVAEDPFICLYKGKGLRVITDAFCREAGFSPNIILESDSPGTVRDLISVGAGLAFVPKISWPGMDSDPSVRLVEIAKPHCTRFVVMRWQSGRYLGEAAARLREYLVAFFAQKAAGG